ncbi:hypothetical protein pipiens_008084 [Culex pipiens pipiens]|uniref:Uncharacterized protein n=1 Tax=Culex pipiens pipiens TaxID=38569 RepID=A0ABD1DJ72_CULPP
MKSSKLLSVIILAAFCIQSSRALPLLDYFTSEPLRDGGSGEPDQPQSDSTDVGSYADSPMIRYDTVVPVLRVVLTPIGRMLQPMIERWLVARFGPYIETVGRALESFSNFATENVSFQTGDTYYTKSDLVDGYGYNSLIINLPSGRSITVLTHKSSRKLNILDEFPQLTEALNEVRKLQ